MVITPTRELAIQIHNWARKFAQGTMVKSVVTYCGTFFNYQADHLTKGCNILVATLGRLMDYAVKDRIALPGTVGRGGVVLDVVILDPPDSEGSDLCGSLLNSAPLLWAGVGIEISIYLLHILYSFSLQVLLTTQPVASYLLTDYLTLTVGDQLQ